jgi:Protein of unknown function (DUF3105)
MARKDRVPNPPKPRVQAPRRRHTPTDQAAVQRKRRTLFLAGGSALVLAALVAGIIFVTSASGSERAALEEAGCTLQAYPGLEGTHLTELRPKEREKWNSFPPTSGTHYGQPAVWDFYDQPVLLVQSVHNLEHGGIVIHYGKDVPDAEIEKIRSWYLEDPNGLLVAPLPALKNKIALTAWTTPDTGTTARDHGRGWLAVCPNFDEDGFSAFVDEHRYKGPERFEPETLVPGT